MQKRLFLLLLAAILASLTLAAGAGAQTVPAGSGMLSGGERLKASGCGKVSEPTTVAFTLMSDGTWNAGEFTGTSSTNGRVVSLTLDAESLEEMDDLLEESASELCEDDVTINTLAVATARLKVNKRRTSAKLQLKVVGTGMSSGGSGTGGFRLKAGGAWVLAPQ